MNDLDFIPFRGKEAALITQAAQLGAIHFATDTGKIFLDVMDEESGQVVHKAIGGSGAAILYATASLEELTNGWVRFARSQMDDTNANINEGDLIINSDGKFLKVVDNTDPDFITCAVIAVSGTGGGGGGPVTPSGSAKIEYAEGTSQSLTVLIGKACNLQYNLIAVDAAGDAVINAGEATWAVSNVVKHTQSVNPGKNSFDIGPYLGFGSQQVTLKIVINTGGDVPTTVRKTWNVTVTELRVEWDPVLNKKYTADKDTTISWMSYGSSLDKTAHIVVDGIHRYTKAVGTVTNASTEFAIPGTVLGHGMHEVELYLSSGSLKDEKGNDLKTDSIKHQLLFIDDANPTPVIVVDQLPGTMRQYDTLSIRYVPYDTAKLGMKTEVIYYENDIQVGEPKEVDNGTIFEWNYTPTTEGYRKLTIACGITKYNIDLEVEKVDLGDIAEVGGYAFKFKASEFSDNSSVKTWNSNGVTVEFSEDFDWVNGGLKSETYDDEGNTRAYVNVRAGNSMTIKYKPFAQNVTSEHGKCVKIIFKATQCRDYDAEVIKSCIYDNAGALQRGFVVGAQEAIFKSQSNTISIPYCEDTYIELEIDITAKGKFNYITSWIDGIPSGIISFTDTDNFDFTSEITVGSEDADVQLYSFKVYEKHLTDTEHLSNFIMDAPNATEIMARFKRNNITDSRGEIDPRLLAKNNPNCRVHCYEIPYMTTSKDVKVDDCNYIQYHGSENAVLTASKVRTRVQGTSSAAYGVAAFNIDADFKGGFDYPDGSHTDKWGMDDKAIPVSYFTTKVNVASCENANNALNQEWYNRYQPYVSPNRKRQRDDGKIARDCMQFYPGVLFIMDHNQNTNKDNAVDNNVFKDTPGYISNPYYKLYAVCNMGNSKKNTEVFHDEENPLECCIEVADNQQDIQRMTRCCGLDTYDKNNIYVDLEKLFEDEANTVDVWVEYDVTDANGNFIERRKKTAYDLWRNVNMSKAGFEFRYPDEFGDNDGDSFEEQHPEQAKIALIGWFNFVKWLADNNPAAATSRELPEPVTYGTYTFKGNGYADTLKGTTISAYADTFTHDTEKYRMAKLLHECEDHMAMDSVMFHYLFIERHTMVDNVAKNTFWSSGDATHWDLTKNYDNDTADGNDNQGKLSLHYGLEPGDTKNLDGTGDSIFNAPGAVWLEFARRLARDTDVGAALFRDREAKGAWNAENYCKEFDEWQSAIPERCWIEAFYRLYRRPLEVYGEQNYLSMLEGGKKTHQRRQFEKYQEMYISSKYFGSVCSGAQLLVRPRADRLGDYNIPISVYADCYVKAGVGQGTGADSINYNRKLRRNEVLEFESPVASVTNATMYLYPGSFFQEFGDEDSHNNLSVYKPEQLGFANAKKLRKLVLGAMVEGEDPTFIANTDLKGQAISFKGNTLLEELYVVGYQAATTDLDLSDCLNLRKVDARESGFSGYLFPNGAPITDILIQKPTTIAASNLNLVSNFSIADHSNMQSLRLVNVDESEAMNSLNILKNIMRPSAEGGTNSTTFAYHLQQVKWKETEASMIANKRIVYLDWLLGKSAQDDGGGSVDSRAALGGELVITEGAYNSADSNEIYDYYCSEMVDGKQRFSNLDIIFEGTNAKMPKVTILDQSGAPYWSRRIANGNSGINEEFFAIGPNGRFVPFVSTEDVANVYEFTGKYMVNGVEFEGNENKYPVIGTAITEDIEIQPVFTTTPNQYTVTIKDATGKDIVKPQQYNYGTKLSDIVKDIQPPAKDSSGLGFFYTYKFKGYKLNANEGIATLEELARTELRSDTTLTAGYEESHVYLNPLDESYFDLEHFKSETDELNTKQNIKLGGKITIPHKLKGITVKKLATGAFQNGHNNRDTGGVTHIFFEPQEFKTPTNYTINQDFNRFGQLSLSVGGAYIEVPPNVTEVVISGEHHWAGGHSGNVFIIPDSIIEIPRSYMAQAKGKWIRREAIDVPTDNVVELLQVKKIGSMAFEASTVCVNTELVLGNDIEFGGVLNNTSGPNYKCNIIRIKHTNTTPNWRIHPDAIVPSGAKLWKANEIIIEGESQNSEFGQFVQTYFEASTWTFID